MLRSLLLVTALFLSFHMLAQTTSILSYNIRYDNPGDGPNAWEERKAAMAAFLQQLHPEVIGIQEGLLHQVEFLEAALPNHTFLGLGRDDGKTAGEFSALFYDSTRLEVLLQGTFWLSETPEKVSTGWDAALPRICTYALFRRRKGVQTFWVFNTHFDHKGRLARESSARLLLHHIQLLNTEQHPLVLIGDFNAEPDTEVYQILTTTLKDAFEPEVQPPLYPAGTFNGFDPELVPDRRIDYAFINTGWQPIRYRHLDPRHRDNRTVSDHLGVFLLLQ